MARERDAGEETETEEEEGPGLHPPRRMTPLEWDMHLQVAELVFRSILEGKRLGKHGSPGDDPEDWCREHLGEAWVQQNRRQRKEVERQMRAEGENTPEWIEARDAMMDLEWEVFEKGPAPAFGERLRSRSAVSREAVLELLRDLTPKFRESYYARCGASSRLNGFRACIAVLHLFMRDAEVLRHCAACLMWATEAHKLNRAALTELTLPLPPATVHRDARERGWSFLRRVLDAIMVQAGADPFAGSWPLGSEGEDRPSAPSRETALALAECVAAVRDAPAMRAQLALLREPVPDGAHVDHVELHAMVPVVARKVAELHAEEPHAALATLLDLLRRAGSEDRAFAALEGGAAARAAAAAPDAGELRSLLGRSAGTAAP